MSQTFDGFADLDGNQLKANILGGRVGERGEAWAAAGLFLIASVIGGGLPVPTINGVLAFAAGPGLMLAGIFIILASISLSALIMIGLNRMIKRNAKSTTKRRLQYRTVRVSSDYSE